MSCREKRIKANPIKEFKKENTLAEVLKANQKTTDVFLGFGMHCFGCPVSQMETLEEAAMVHGVDLNLLLEKLNEVIR